MLNGYKTKFGSVGLVLTGVALIINSLVDDTPNLQGIMEGAGMIATALAAFGIGSKIDRQ